MARRILGPTGSRRRRRFLLGPLVAVALAALYLTAGAQAVHDIGLFQLDGNASTAVNSTPPALEDWDLICKAHLVSATEPDGCTFAPGYAIPAGTTTASPSSFLTDPSESNVDDILKGGTKDDNDIPSWTWNSAKPSPPKNDLTHAYAAEYTCDTSAGCSGTDGDKVLYFGADRFSTGVANVAFWFFQEEVTQVANGPNDTCVGGSGCPFTGVHTEGDVSLGGTTPGDILIISAFGPQAEINVFEWVGPGNATQPCFTNACSLEPLFEGGADCSAVTNDPACAVTNAVVEPSPWTVNQKNAPANSFQPTNFFEGGLNLTELGVDACFSSFLINSRSSASGDAELHDKVLGQFARCVPEMTTQASTAGPVTPGTAVHDTATITVLGAANPDDPTGDVTFFLCGPIATGACDSGGTNVGTGTLDGGADPNDGVASADSPDVNTAASATGVLTPGRYCFRAEWPGDSNYPDALSFTNDTDECFTVAKIPSSTVTTPVDGSGVETHTIALGGSIQDKAVVTGTVAGGIPTGTVDFFVCGPTPLSSTDLCTTGGTAVPGNPRPLDAGNVGPPPFATAISGVLTPTAVGRYCFRAEYSGSDVYEPSSDDGEATPAPGTECFIVTDSTSIASLQNWLPNDSATVTSTSGAALNGTLVFTLRAGSCTSDDVKYTEPTITLSNTASGTSFSTTNGSVAATTFRVTAANNQTPYFWRIVFTPTSEFVSGFTKCETTDITINDNP
jgi:hypothetical protein